MGQQTNKSTKQLLLVEDNEELRHLLQSRLEKYGFSCISTGNGLDAIVLTKELKPDAIILDLLLPGLNGNEVCKVIRKNETTKNIPIIMLTAKDTDVDRVIGKVIGADYYLTKPCDFSILLDRINYFINT